MDVLAGRGEDCGEPLAAKDTDDFDSFYRAEYQAIVRVAAVVLGRLDIAEEVAQEAFLSASLSWTKVAVYEQPGAWVRRVVLNRCASIRRRRILEGRWLDRARTERPAEAAGPEVLDLRVWDALRSLPSRQRTVLALMFVEDHSAGEVARILGCSEATVRTHAARGRSSMANKLQIGEP